MAIMEGVKVGRVLLVLIIYNVEMFLPAKFVALHYKRIRKMLIMNPLILKRVQRKWMQGNVVPNPLLLIDQSRNGKIVVHSFTPSIF